MLYSTGMLVTVDEKHQSSDNFYTSNKFIGDLTALSEVISFSP